jgi:hypothetical protein
MIVAFLTSGVYVQTGFEAIVRRVPEVTRNVVLTYTILEPSFVSYRSE